MMRTVVSVALFVILSASDFAQSAETPPANAPIAATSPSPTFVIADIHPSPHHRFALIMGPRLRGDRYILRQGDMRDLIGLAYGVNPGYVKGGPPWLETDRYDITAKMPPKTTPEETKLMLRDLLEKRFKLVARQTTAPAPGQWAHSRKRQIEDEAVGWLWRFRVQI